MIFHGQEFEFSSLNANDIERMEQANARFQAASHAEAARAEREHLSYSNALRGQCRVVMQFIDEVFGAGASERLGLDGNDLGKALNIVKEAKAAVAAEKQAFQADAAPIPQNREQRRAQQKKKQHPPQPVQFPAQEPPAAAMVNRVDKQARQKELMRELMREFLKEHSAELYDG